MQSSSQRRAVHPGQPCGWLLPTSVLQLLPTPRGAALWGQAYQVGLLPRRALRTLVAQPGGLVVELILATAGLLRVGPAHQGRLPRGRGSFGLHSPLETPTVSGRHLEVVVEEPWGGPLPLMTWQSSPVRGLIPNAPHRELPGLPLKAGRPLPAAPNHWCLSSQGARGLTFPVWWPRGWNLAPGRWAGHHHTDHRAG